MASSARADEAAHEAQAGAQAIRGEGEIDRHAAALEVSQIEVVPAEGAGEAGVVQPGGMADEGGENRTALFLGTIEIGGGGARDDPVAAERVGQHVGEHVSPVVFRGGEDGPELAHAATVGRQAGDIDQQTAEEFARCFCPVRVVLGAGRDDEHLGHGASQGDDVRIVGIEGIEPVHAVAGRARDAEGVDEKNILTGIAAGAGGDGIIFALEVEDEGGARIIQEVGDDGADAFAGAGGGHR